MKCLVILFSIDRNRACGALEVSIAPSRCRRDGCPILLLFERCVMVMHARRLKKPAASAARSRSMVCLVLQAHFSKVKSICWPRMAATATTTATATKMMDIIIISKPSGLSFTRYQIQCLRPAARFAPSVLYLLALSLCVFSFFKFLRGWQYSIKNESNSNHRFLEKHIPREWTQGFTIYIHQESSHCVSSLIVEFNDVNFQETPEILWKS